MQLVALEESAAVCHSLFAHSFIHTHTQHAHKLHAHTHCVCFQDEAPGEAVAKKAPPMNEADLEVLFAIMEDPAIRKKTERANNFGPKGPYGG